MLALPRKVKGVPVLPGRLFLVYRVWSSRSGCVAGAGDEFRDRVAFTVPHTHQQLFCAAGIFKNVKNVCITAHLKKPRSSCISPHRCAHAKERSQLENSILRM